MKTRARKKEDLGALTEQFKNSKSAMVLSFSKLTVEKDQQFRNELRETGATYKVVKNTLARLAAKDTAFEEAIEHFKGVTSVAWTNEEPVDLSKVISKYLKDYKDILEFKTGVVEGKVVNLEEVKAIAELPTKDELIAKILYLLNSPAQRLATVLNAVPRDLAIVVKQISEGTGAPAEAAAETKAEAPAEEAPKEEAKADEASAETEEPKAGEAPAGEAPEAEGSKEISDEKSEDSAEESAE
ncbi:MAG: 50S ribosomal protein L10 [Acidobacteria bacterium]|nr:50S ribosomal protein L10 [Acidobacteriota bacterium]